MSSNELDIVIRARDEASNVMANVMRSMGSMADFSKMSNEAIHDSFKDVRQEVRLNQSAMRTLGMEFRNENMEAYAFTGALSRTGAVVSRLTTAYSQYTLMQIREQQAAEHVENSQSQYNETIQRFGPASQQAQSAQKQLVTAQQQYDQVVKQNQLGLAGLIIQFGTQLPTAIMSSIEAWRTFSKVGGVTGLIANVSTGLAAIGGGSVAAGVATGGFAIALVALTAALEKSIEPQKRQLQGITFTEEETNKLTEAENRLGLSHDVLLATIRKGSLTQEGFNQVLGSTSQQYDDLYQKVQNYGTTLQQVQGTYAGGKFIPTPDVATPNYAYYDYLDRLQSQAVTITITADTSQAQSGIAAVNGALQSISGNTVPMVDVNPGNSFGTIELINGLLNGIPGFKMIQVMVELLLGGGGFSPRTYQHGGIVPGSGPQLAVVHGGERITPENQSTNMQTTMYNNIYNMNDWNRTLRRFDSYVVGKVRSR